MVLGAPGKCNKKSRLLKIRHEEFIRPASIKLKELEVVSASEMGRKRGEGVQRQSEWRAKRPL